MKGLVVDDALKPGTQIGPVVDQRQLDQDLRYIAHRPGRGREARLGRRAAEARHARASTWRRRCSPRPTTAMRISREEIFGPVASVIRVKDYDEALAIANDTRVRPVGRHLHDSLKHATPLQAQQRGRHGDGQPADRRASTTTCRSAAARARATARASRGATRRSSTPRSRPPTPSPERAVCAAQQAQRARASAGVMAR